MMKLALRGVKARQGIVLTVKGRAPPQSWAATYSARPPVYLYFLREMTLWRTRDDWRFNMFDSLWTFLQDSANRAVLGWIGGGIVVVASGIWAVVKLFSRKGDGGSSSGTSVQGKSVSVGRDNIKSPINIDTRRSGKR